MRARSYHLPAAIAPLLLVELGCGATSWSPPPPAGQTYQYDHQGYQSSDTTVVAGSGPRVAYGAAFHFRRAKGVHEEEGGKNPFVQSAPIDGIRFNEHLPGQGTRLGPGGAPSATATPPRLPGGQKP